MTGIRELYELQETDKQLDSRNQRVVQVERDLRGSAALIAAQAELAARQRALRDAEAKQREFEYEATSNQTRITALDQRMYSQGGAPKELQSITSEIAHLKERQKGLDTAVLEAMEATDRLRESADAQGGAVKNAEGNWASARNVLTMEKARLERELSEWRVRRDQQSIALAPGSLRLYEQLRASRGNLAVVKAERGACSGCRMIIPTTLVQKAKAGKDLVYCSSCSRLLFVA